MLKQDEIIELFKLENSHAKKELGQNFLLNEDVPILMAENLELKNEDKLLEIGPGLGALTEKLINKTSKFVAVEYDEKFVKFLNNAYSSSNIEVIKNNILKTKDFDFNKIAGNLPYYISTEIIEFVATNFKDLEVGVFMVQKEFFERITSKDKRVKGPLNYLLEYLFDIKKIVNVPKKDFFPIPTVDSIVFKIERNFEKDWGFAWFLYKILRFSFQNRRKNIVNNLKNYLSSDELNTILNNVNIDKNLRAEDLNLSNFIDLTNEILKVKKLKL